MSTGTWIEKVPRVISSPRGDMGVVLERARAAALTWAEVPLAHRLAIVRRARHSMAAQARDVAASVAHRPIRDTLVAEVLPLLDAMRFLERRAAKLLAARRVRGGRPLWLFGVRSTIHRQPLGAVLVIAPANYPLFLSGTQALQALVAGNSVCIKPAPGGSPPAHLLVRHLVQAGLAPDLLQVLAESEGPAAAGAGFDRIVLTGAADTGIQVLRAAAPLLTPTAMELSGCDAVFVLPGADLALVARCLAYGMGLNGGATCIAPRRVFVSADAAQELESLLLPRVAKLPAAQIAAKTRASLDALLAQATALGARLYRPRPDGPVVLLGARPSMQLLKRDVFAPWLALLPVASMTEALRADRMCPYHLGASIFGPTRAAERFASQVDAGSICINDVIVPTADPRLSFGGSGGSGFGRTRGTEGLLEMTNSKVVSTRRGPLRPHLAEAAALDEQRYLGMIRLLHASGRDRWVRRSRGSPAAAGDMP
jgi:acyl-CoA reductase-like NAD-dependent aldehyde dehydrogenase